MYASKRRQRNFKRVREPSKPSTSTNPSKRHRERLNGELETVALLLPYDPTTISRLDKLSVLRLAVSFLQVKAHFQACLHSLNFVAPFPLPSHQYIFQPRTSPFLGIPTIHEPHSGQSLLDPKESDFESIALKALGGFILIINDNGDIYYASENIETFLGFHQSDVLHQPLFDLIHSEDRDDIRQQLDITFALPNPTASNQDLFLPENSSYLERNVNARFRCLLDNTCGFLRIDIRGRLLSLHGLPTSYIINRNNSMPIMGLLAVCTPFVPPSTPDVVPEDLILKSKHHLDGTLVSMDEKVHEMLELGEQELPVSFYQVIHPEDAVCLAEAHKEVLKNGSSGLLIYRLISAKSRRTYFVQSSCRMFYKNGKPESIGLTHRLLNEVEGMMLLEKRSSLKAKLLSFDDSFLQSPRNLQSTAALPLPMKEDFPSDESTRFPSPRVKKRRDDLSLLAPLKLPIGQWTLPVRFPPPPSFGQELPPFLPAPELHWTPENAAFWPPEFHPGYPALPSCPPAVDIPASIVPYTAQLPPLPVYPSTNLEYAWNSLPQPSLTLPEMEHCIDFGLLKEEPASTLTHSADFISEVANTLLSQ